MSSLEALRKERNALDAKLWELERAEKDARNQTLIGKCFRYRNSYGSNERWWLYAKVINSVGGWPRVFKFEKTSHDEYSVCPQNVQTSLSGWEEITPGIFEKEWAKFSKEMIASFDKTEAKQ